MKYNFLIKVSRNRYSSVSKYLESTLRFLFILARETFSGRAQITVILLIYLNKEARAEMEKEKPGTEGRPRGVFTVLL